MNAKDYRTSLSLAAIFSFRMLGLFMILPIFALYAHQLNGSNANLIGLALGIAGLTQTCLQIPFGLLSDKFGRKPMILIGLLLFLLGGIVAALSHSIYGVIIGRALQGAGAIGSVIIALLADLTSEQNRTKAMAIIGISIGSTFSIAMVLGPLLSGWLGLQAIFWLSSSLGFAAILILYLGVPKATSLKLQRDAETIPSLFGTVLRNKELLRLDFAIFCQHAILTAVFVAIPVMLSTEAGVLEQQQWLVYLPALLLSFIAMLPFIIIAEKYRKMKQTLLGAITVLMLCQLAILILPARSWIIGIYLFLFFTGFTLLEACLPSLVSKIAPAGSRGTAMGVYSSSQFFGIFVGGTFGGWLYGHHELQGVFIFCAALALLWLFLTLSMKQPPYLATFTLNVGTIDRSSAQHLQRCLLAEKGVAEALVNPEEGIAYLKIDSKTADKLALTQLVERAK